jgi:hypothetical protein
MIGKMRKSCLLMIGALLLVLTGAVTQSEAMGGRVDIGVNLPAHRFTAPPDVVVIPGTYVYMVPDTNVDILFYQGYWYRPYEGRWYRSRDYNGQWNYIETRSIPNGLRALPQDYRHRLSPRYKRIPNRDLQSNWQKWEKEKYWDRQGKKDRGRHSDQNRRGQDKNDRRGYDDQNQGGYGNQNQSGRDEQKGRY